MRIYNGRLDTWAKIRRVFPLVRITFVSCRSTASVPDGTFPFVLISVEYVVPLAARRVDMNTCFSSVELHRKCYQALAWLDQPRA